MNHLIEEVVLIQGRGHTDTNYLYTGEQFDGELDLYYLRARYYDQSVGRFTQMDTWQGCKFKPLSLQKYLYTEADPANKVDSSGYTSVMTMNTNMAVMSALNVSTVVKYTGYLMAAAGAVYLIENKSAENSWMMAESSSSPNIKTENDRVAYEGNRR